ncbi:major facilitator superfamily domain-containing protein [Dissophora ornata]|nr:major facilitator superfamily domain-containing protein [Dissophora ornata]
MPPPSGQQLHCHAPGMGLPRVIPCRYWIILLGGIGLMISYADRSNMAVAVVAIAREHGYSKQQQGLILASFFFGYILTPIMGGTLADRYGGKSILAIGALVWSICTLLTPFASGIGLFWIVLSRIALGLGEGVAYPSIHAMIGTWIPPSERSKAVATVTAFSYLGSVIALPTSSALVVSSWGWRGIFWLFGFLGLSWSLAWQIWGASDPTSCRWITEYEKHWILHQQLLDQEVGRSNGTHHLSERRDSSFEQQPSALLDPYTRTIDFDGAPVTYQSLASTAALATNNGEQGITPPTLPSVHQTCEDSEGEIQAASSCVQSSSDENDLVYRADAVAPLPTSAKDSRWQAFRNRMRSKKLQEQRGLRRGDKVTVPWKELLTRREVWAIILSQLFNSVGFFVMQSWIPTFYLDFYGVEIGKVGYYAVVPSAVQGIMGLFAGYLGDKATQDWHWSTLTVRRVGQSLGSLGLGVFLLVAVNFAHTAASAMVLITIGMALNGFTMIGASTYQHDFCAQHAGFIFSLGNTAGSIPALIGVFLVGVLLDSNGGNRWALIWTAVCTFYVLGTAAFVFLSTSKRFPYTMPTK